MLSWDTEGQQELAKEAFRGLEGFHEDAMKSTGFQSPGPCQFITLTGYFIVGRGR